MLRIFLYKFDIRVVIRRYADECDVVNYPFEQISFHKCHKCNCNEKKNKDWTSNKTLQKKRQRETEVRSEEKEQTKKIVW